MISEAELIEIERLSRLCEGNRDICQDPDCKFTEHIARQKIHFLEVKLHREIERLIEENRKLKARLDTTSHHL